MAGPLPRRIILPPTTLYQLHLLWLGTVGKADMTKTSFLAVIGIPTSRLIAQNAVP